MGRGATALVSDAHTAEIAYTPYQRPPDAAALRTAIPRGLRSFVVRKAVLALKPVNDTELLSINAILAPGFGYVLNELHVNILQDRAAQFEANGMLVIADSSRALEDFDYRIPLAFENYSNNGTNTQAMGTRVPAGILPRTPVVPQSGSLVSMRFANLDATAAAAGTVNGLISFWEYDLEQLAWFAAHVAVSTATR